MQELNSNEINFITGATAINLQALVLCETCTCDLVTTPIHTPTCDACVSACCKSGAYNWHCFSRAEYGNISFGDRCSRYPKYCPTTNTTASPQQTEIYPTIHATLRAS